MWGCRGRGSLNIRLNYMTLKRIQIQTNRLMNKTTYGSKIHSRIALKFNIGYYNPLIQSKIETSSMQ